MKTRVAVVYGGRSGEHEVSLRSAESIMQAMDPERYEIQRFLIDKNGKWSPGPILPEPGANTDIDVIFPVLHGTFGEDGTVQGLFELADIAYVGAGVMASAVSMDKAMMKQICGQANLPVVDWVVIGRHQIDVDRVAAAFPFPVFVKPANLGSSVGISKAKNRQELEKALRLAAEFDRKIIIERSIAGREFECSVMGNDDPKASMPCEIFPSREFYDYEDKYLLNQARFELPARLPQAEIEKLRRLAIACYRAVECTGLARVDFLREGDTEELYINEINTMPGFTPISMYPKMWEQSGISFAELIDKLITLALERHAEKKATRFSR
jgi:D-alanine-D-alanine ligase